MKNKLTISFYHPKACQPETSATRLTPTKRSRTHTHTHTQRVPITFTKTRGVAMSTTPPYILFLSFIYIKNVYSRREGYFGGVLSVW